MILSEVSGFSKFTKDEKINWLNEVCSLEEDVSFYDFKLQDEKLQKTFEEFSENTISNFILPMGIAPNFLINDKLYAVPMVIEESSVVAAASNAAKFWLKRGGFKVEIISEKKLGHVHFEYSGNKENLYSLFNEKKHHFFDNAKEITKNMEKRGGGVLELNLLDHTDKLENYYKLEASFKTCDAMGANFINSVLENFAKTLMSLDQDILVIMSILSNYTPECLVHVKVESTIEDLNDPCLGMDSKLFSKKFKKAVDIATVDKTRAVTHNKGIMNGIDSVILATGNDFRATEACIHAYASKDGEYKSLSKATVDDDKFTFEMTIPLAVGTVGGLTSLHPLAKKSLEILGKPNASNLMGIIASVGLAQNFAALKSLVTTGIQKGHMKMHLLNILNQFMATEDEIILSKKYFEDKVVSFSDVRNYLETLRIKH